MTKLEKMLKYVSEHNEFYRNRIKEYGIKDPLDITQWPILTRKELQENRYNMFSDGYKSKYFYQQLRRKSSSGSSGVPVNVYWDDSDYYASVKPLWNRRLQNYGIRPNDRQVIFGLHTTDKSFNTTEIFYVNEPEYILNVDINSVVLNETYHELVDLIEKFRPVWLYVRPFILKILIKSYHITNKEPPSSIKYIESTGELLPPDLKEAARDCFKATIINMYGSEEANGIAYECPNQKMHIIEDNVYLECMNNMGEIKRSGEGEAIITSLTNKAMPLIRYNQGDEIVLEHTISSDSCLCKSSSAIIKIIKGRTLDSIKLNDKTTLNSLVFLEIISYVNNQLNTIIDFYKFTYYESTKVVSCDVVLDPSRSEWYTNVKNLIEEMFQKIIPPSLGVTIKISAKEFDLSSNVKNRIFEIK